ncbi:MAG: Na(+)-translocating NADH-quinone reductase subunit A [Shewanellaceae bacterium]|nr:Na(+)-translocating NADH-quinone reductase subunit A [Shewanellaceae bacterium]
MITIRKGLDLPIVGKPEQKIYEGPFIRQVAILGEDYEGMRPTMKVKVGDVVKKGQVLFEDKKNPGIKFTAPMAGTVHAINRGLQRVLQSVVLTVQGDAAVEFSSFKSSDLANLPADKIRTQMIDSGLWTALRTRPYSKIPAVDAEPMGIFVNAMDTNPLAADPTLIIQENRQHFIDGLTILSKVSQAKKLFLTKAPQADIPSIDAFEVHQFAGKHPAGLVGTHIHYLMPVSSSRSVWHINYQDVILLGHLFTTGQLAEDIVVALGGPQVKNPRLLRTKVGASITDLVVNDALPGDNRLISGSVLIGTRAKGPHAFLGRYHRQITIIEEDTNKELLGWLSPGINKFSATRAFLGHINPLKKFNLTSSTHGSDRSMVPIGVYEKIMPLDILPTMLLRDLISRDTDSAQRMGCLELDEEDLALCTFACPGKYDHGLHLRACLDIIEREG